MTVFPKAQARPLTPADMGLHPDREGLPLPLVMDGRVQQNNLLQAGRDEGWLRALLGGRGLAPEAAYLAVLDTQGRMTLQMKGGGLLRFRAMDGSEVKW